MKNIRNFCIIAHIDHGKSTLADRFLEITGTVDKRIMKDQLLDSMDLEKERGITIKLQPVRMEWKGYILNLIDTPGHVDFSFEISRSLAACEGAILVVDASQGIEAQTLANLFLAVEQDLEIIPVLNKIDLPAADPERVKTEINNVLGIPKEDILAVSAKEGTGVAAILDKIIEKVPSPDVAGLRKKCKIEEDGITRALVFNSHFDQFRGVVAFVRVVSGCINKKDKLIFMSNNKEVEVLDCGFFKPKLQSSGRISAGEVGFVVTGSKNAAEVKAGDTLASAKVDMLPGFRLPAPMVYAGFFPEEADDYQPLRDALEKLSLEDSAMTFEPETSAALGNGFRLGFLGLLHLDIIQERLHREFDLSIIVTTPSVPYEILRKNGEMMTISSPQLLPDPSEIDKILEPWVGAEILVPSQYVGAVMDLITKRRGLFKNMQHPSENRAVISAELPLANVITDFHDALKSVSSGYASMSFELLNFRPDDLVKIDILLADKIAHAFSQIVHRTEAQARGNQVCRTLKDLLPKKQFVIKIQAAIGSRIIARETISALRKDVTAKLYGGDVTRKNKLLKKQKKGKKKMMSMGTGSVEIPRNVFLKVLRDN